MNTTKNCNSCGAPNDAILINCVYCKSPLPKTDPNLIDTEELIIKCGEWLGRLEGAGYVSTSQGMKLGVQLQAPPGYKPPRNLQNLFGLNEDSSTVYVPYSEIVGNVEKYLNLIEVRAKNNATLTVTYEGFREKYKRISQKVKKKIHPLIYGIGGLVGMFLLIFLIFKSCSSDHEVKVEKENERLEAIVTNINEAIKEKNYDYALILTDQLVWKFESSYSPTDEEGKHWEKQRKNLKETIENLKKQSQQKLE